MKNPSPRSLPVRFESLTITPSAYGFRVTEKGDEVGEYTLYIARGQSIKLEAHLNGDNQVTLGWIHQDTDEYGNVNGRPSDLRIAEALGRNLI